MSELTEAAVAKILLGFQTSVMLLQDIGPRLQDNTVIIAKMEEKLERLKEDTLSLSRIIKDSNGDSMLTRITIIEETLKTIVSTQALRRSENSQFQVERHNMIAAVLSGVLALLAAVFAAWVALK